MRKCLFQNATARCKMCYRLLSRRIGKNGPKELHLIAY